MKLDLKTTLVTLACTTSLIINVVLAGQVFATQGSKTTSSGSQTIADREDGLPELRDQVDELRNLLLASQLDVATLVGDVSNLLAERTQAPPSPAMNQQLQPPKKGASQNIPEHYEPTVSERFELAASDGTDSGAGISGIDSAFYDQELAGIDLNYSSCTGTMCRISYSKSSNYRARSSMAEMELPAVIAEHVGRDVNIYHVNENGESILYVELN